jgi:hypothetical protein
MPEDLELVVEQNRQILAALTALRADVAAIKGELAGITHRFAAMDGRLAHLQTIGTWLIAGLMGSYAAILAVALRLPVPHP